MEDAPATTGVVDAEKVASGVRFLSHPDVQTTPLAERLAFLEKKGLSRAEINAAIEQHHQANAVLAKPEPAASSSLWSILFPMAGTTAVLGFLWKFMQYDEANKLEQETANAAAYARESTASTETALVQAIQAQTAEMMKLMSVMQLEAQERRALLSSQTTTSHSISELRAELASLQAAVAKLGSQPAPAKTPVTTEAIPKSPVAATDDTAADFQARAKKMLEALKLVELDNNAEVVKQAAGILIMYTKNLVEQPDVPRYRRIATGNANYKQKIEPLQHHLALLTSIGFEKVGMSMEWKWHGQPASLVLLKAAVHAFESAVASNGDVLAIAAESFLSANAPTAIEAPTLPEPAAEATPNLDSFLQKLGAKSCTEDDKSTTEPSYPASFADVMKMVQNGEEVPGIRTIEDKLSAEAQARLDAPVAAPASKPWAT
ncbi:hypothetical protein ACHHYP_12765 [Achlya hypogyna]|uniref:Peroxisomal membrane protein PEX14 n=1 Tax=Achlya hypogyna TaxID=1202772 RepID=A0A1V9ZGH1_ACHHY|nr:hypothetical protein ACHHYP_12765 [Achlya hypogyna]